LASIIKGISVDVSVAGLYLIIYQWVLGMHASYWCAGGKGLSCEGDSGTLWTSPKRRDNSPTPGGDILEDIIDVNKSYELIKEKCPGLFH
jgi:hypothetical protein